MLLVKRFLVPFAIIILFPVLFWGWGQIGHNLINKKTTDGFPNSMLYYKSWSSALASMASNADYRKSSDPTEEFRHYIDIDVYPEFVANGRISHSLDSMIALHGSAMVNDNGVLPWAIVKTTDSLKGLLRNRDWTKARITAADLGHYVGDAHMPLHITNNYNGQLSGQTGIHSRYESTMLSKYQTQLQCVADSSNYVADKTAYTFAFVYENYKYVDTLLQADIAAKAAAGGSTSSNLYYQELWDRTKLFTNKLLSNGSSRLSDLIYTAWVDAGKPDSLTFVDFYKQVGKPQGFQMQAYPNPFNAQVSITFRSPDVIENNSMGELIIFDLTGVAVYSKELLLQPGTNYQEHINLQNAASGVYYSFIKVAGFSQAKKLVLLK